MKLSNSPAALRAARVGSVTLALGVLTSVVLLAQSQATSPATPAKPAAADQYKLEERKPEQFLSSSKSGFVVRPPKSDTPTPAATTAPGASLFPPADQRPTKQEADGTVRPMTDDEMLQYLSSSKAGPFITRKRPKEPQRKKQK